MMTTELKKFYEDEVKDITRFLNADYGWAKPKEVVHNAVDRCLGAAYFAQRIGADYDEVSLLYEDVKHKLEGLL